MTTTQYLKKLTIPILFLSIGQLACASSYVPKQANRAYLTVDGNTQLTVTKNKLTYEVDRFVSPMGCDMQAMNFASHSAQKHSRTRELAVRMYLLQYFISPLLSWAIFGRDLEAAQEAAGASLVDAVNRHNDTSNCFGSDEF